MAQSKEQNTSADAPQEVPSAMRGRPGPMHEELWSAIREEVLLIVQEYAPTFGEVTGMDGGKVLVAPDGDEDARTVGLTKKRGQRYKPGDRVKIQKSRSGEEFIDGSFGSKAGKDEVVGEDDLYDDSVTSNKIKQNAVGKEAIAPAAVEKGALDKSATDYIDAQGAKGDAAMEKAKEAQQTANDKADKSHTHNYAENNHSHNYADKQHDHNGYASNNHSHAIGDISKLETRLSALESDVKKLKEKGN